MLLDDVADYLSTGGIGTVGVDLFKGYLPDTPDAAGAVYETGGMEPYRAMASGPGQAVCEHPRVQVVWRGAAGDYSAPRLKMSDVFRRMDGAGDLTINGVRYLWMAAVQSPFLMGRDESTRPLIACNFDVVKALSTA